MDTSNQPKKNGFKPNNQRYYLQPFIFLLFQALMLGIFTAFVLPVFPWFDFLSHIPFLAVGGVILANLLVIDLYKYLTNRGKTWYSNYPIKQWAIYPSNNSEWLTTALVVMVLLMGVYIWMPNWVKNPIQSIESWYKSWSLSSLSGEDNIDTTTAEIENGIGEVATIPAAGVGTLITESVAIGTSMQQVSEACISDGFRDSLCIHLPSFEEYWDALSGVAVDNVPYSINRIQKCWSCGNVLTGEGRNPPTCNPFISTMTGRNPSTGEFSPSYSCLEPPKS